MIQKWNSKEAITSCCTSAQNFSKCLGSFEAIYESYYSKLPHSNFRKPYPNFIKNVGRETSIKLVDLLPYGLKASLLSKQLYRGWRYCFGNETLTNLLLPLLLPNTNFPNPQAVWKLYWSHRYFKINNSTVPRFYS